MSKKTASLLVLRDVGIKTASLFVCTKMVVRRNMRALEGITVKEAGRRGGLSLLNKLGHSHFAEIGKKGQEATRKRYPGMATAWGKRGGRPRKNNL